MNGTLKLLETDEPKPKKKVFWGFICWSIMVKVNKELRDSEPPESRGQALGLLRNWSRTEPTDRNGNWGGAFYDTESGEIIFDEPTPEVFERRYRNYFNDEWSAQNMGLSLVWFLKNYPKWEKHQVSKRKVESKPVMYLCPKCKKNVDQNHYCE